MSKPTVFHVTHWKAGSQWVRAVFEAAAPSRVVRPPGRGDPLWFFNQPLVDGGIYTPVYAAYEQFRGTVPADQPQRTFFLIRDPRDTAVSWYFSLRYSHSLADASVRESREILTRLNKADGLALVICNHLNTAMSIQQSWLNSGGRIFKYEELLRDQQDTYRQIFEYCELDVSEAARRRIVNRNSFSRKTWWRWGRESVKSHLRKGEAGDWKNHFDDRHKKLFKLHHSDTLIQAGYERDDNW